MIQDLYPDEARYLSKIAIFFVHPCIRRPPYESPRRNIAMPFGAQTLEWCGYPMAKKLEDMWNRFDRMSACDIQTDGRASCDGIFRAMHRIARQTRKNRVCCKLAQVFHAAKA